MRILEELSVVGDRSPATGPLSLWHHVVTETIEKSSMPIISGIGKE